MLRQNILNKLIPGMDSTVVLPENLGRGRVGDTERLIERLGEAERRGFGLVKV